MTTPTSNFQPPTSHFALPTSHFALPTSRLIDDHAEWNATLASLPVHHVLQSWEWGQFKSRWGWQARYVLFESDGHPRAAALILRRWLPLLGLGVMYVPKGPALDYADAALVESVLAEIEAIARRERAIFVKIDPDVPHPPTPSPRLGEGERVVAQMVRRGWRFSAEQIQFRNTVLLDVTPPEEELLAAMKPKTRYNIRLASKKGVSVRAGGIEDLDALYAMYAETARRDAFIIRPIEYYRDAWSSCMSAGLAQPLIAEAEGQAIAGLIVFRFGARAWYMYGMSREAHRDRMPNHLLQWEAIRWARSRGCAVYDWWGAPDELNQADPMWGVYRFKQGFGGKFTAHIGAYDSPASKFWYWIYSVVMPRVLDVMRGRHRRNLGL
ncbi:MAG TPA: peptidoglycan bridge formation glycyltransferase FemA/FemB family protein [Anaerolineae bacterium]|nr:peptidoglycan bridge formation glycyltransferase FemA/FemB family protein [Anaerolineae bacterium]